MIEIVSVCVMAWSVILYTRVRVYLIYAWYVLVVSANINLIYSFDVVGKKREG